MKRDTAFNELFIGVIRGLYPDQTITLDEFKDHNAELLKNKWIDTRHGSAGEKIYELFDEETEGDIVKELLQEWLCDNCLQIMNCISITLRNHERTYAEWFRYIEEHSGPDELALYSLSRKYGIHTAVFNKSYVWTTLSEHIHRTDEEIFSLCGINLVFLGETTYGIIRKIRAPEVPPPDSKQNKANRAATIPPTGKTGKITCRSNTKQPLKRGRGHGRTRRKTAHTLSESCEANYGISAQHTAVRSTSRTRAQIDYLALNDGLEEETRPSPKRKKYVTHRPKGAPSTARIAAQKSMSSPKSERKISLSFPTPCSTLSGVPVESTDLPLHSSETTEPERGLSGVLGKLGDLNTKLVTSAAEVLLTGVPSSANENVDNQTLPDLVVNRGTAINDKNTTSTPSTSTIPELQQDLEAASVLLSLHDEIRDDTLDEADEDDNAVLMPIGGIGAPIDAAPQEIRLDQPNVDAAIAEILQNELNQEELAGLTNQPLTNPPDQHHGQFN